LQSAVIVTVVAVHVMQVSVDEIIDVVAMGHRLVSASGAVGVSALRIGRAARGVSGADSNHMLVDVISVHVMQMTVVQIIDMPVMPDGGMSAVRAMLMGVVGMMLLVTFGHGSFLWLGSRICARSDGVPFGGMFNRTLD
jgi:hypothetical protein